MASSVFVPTGRRNNITDGYMHGDCFIDHYMPRRLDECMYFADAQMDDGVYVYGSFLYGRCSVKGIPGPCAPQRYGAFFVANKKPAEAG